MYTSSINFLNVVQRFKNSKVMLDKNQPRGINELLPFDAKSKLVTTLKYD